VDKGRWVLKSQALNPVVRQKLPETFSASDFATKQQILLLIAAAADMRKIAPAAHSADQDALAKVTTVQPVETAFPPAGN